MVEIRTGDYAAIKAGMTRRELMAKAAALGLVVGATGGVVGFLGGCGSKGSSVSPTGSPAGGSPWPITSDAIVFENDISEGGFGTVFWRTVGDAFHKRFPNITYKQIADGAIWSKLQPRFVTGNVPAISYPGWDCPKEELRANGLLLPLDDLLAAPAYGQPGITVRDTLDPRMVIYSTGPDGTWYYMNLAEENWYWHYNKTLWDEKGWTVPTTWTDFLALCEEIKSAGMAPIGFSGRNNYWSDGGFLQLCYKIGGNQWCIDADNLKPGAWNSEPVLEAMNMTLDLEKRGYFMDNWQATEFMDMGLALIGGKAALIASGSWFENEIKADAPDDFVFGAMAIPGVEGGDGDPTAIRAFFSETQIVPAKSSYPNEAKEYYRMFFSKQYAQEFARTENTAMPVKGWDEGLTKPSSGLVALTALRKAARETWDLLLAQWYIPMYIELANPVTACMSRKISVKAFGEQMEALAEQTRQDPNVVKRVRGESLAEPAREA